MILYPAIDVRSGKVVRLREGDPSQQTIFSDDPVSTAQRWINAGAQWIHMVNLDGAFAAANDNLRVLEAAAQLGTPLQFGGGLRTMADMQRAIDAGASRIVLGTVAVQNPDLVSNAIVRYGADRVCIGLDSRDGMVTTHGWSQSSELTPTELGSLMKARGVIHALFTDVRRDGALEGSAVDATVALGRETGLQVIASGGITSLDEIRRLAASRSVSGAVIGMALYQGKLNLVEAIAAAEGT